MKPPLPPCRPAACRRRSSCRPCSVLLPSKVRMPVPACVRLPLPLMAPPNVGGAGEVENQQGCCRSRVTRCPGAGAADLQCAGRDRRAAAIGVRSRQHQCSQAHLRQAAGAADDAGESCRRCRRLKASAALSTTLPAMLPAAAAVAHLQRAGRRSSCRPCRCCCPAGQNAAAGLRQAAGAADRCRCRSSESA